MTTNKSLKVVCWVGLIALGVLPDKFDLESSIHAVMGLEILLGLLCLEILDKINLK